MKITEGSTYNPSNDAYREMMTREQAKRLPHKPKTKDQCPSTKAALEFQKTRSKAEDSAWASRPLPNNWKALPNVKIDLANPASNKNIDDFVGKKEFDAEQVAVVQDIRRKSRNTLGDAVSTGGTSLTPEKKEHAVNAFRSSGAAELSPEQELRIKNFEMQCAKELDLAKETAKQASKDLEEQRMKKEARIYWFKRIAACLVFLLAGAAFYYFTNKPITREPLITTLPKNL